MIECTEDEQTFTAIHKHNEIRVWKGRDFWHKDFEVQARYDDDGSIFLSTQEGHVSTLKTKTITIEQFFSLIKSAIS